MKRMECDFVGDIDSIPSPLSYIRSMVSYNGRRCPVASAIVTLGEATNLMRMPQL